MAIFFLTRVGLANNLPVECPSAISVKQSWMLLDAVSKTTVNNRYQVWQSFSTLEDSSHRAWNVITFANARNMNQALTIGQGVVKNVCNNKQVKAIEMNGEYFCTYSTNHPLHNVATVSAKDAQESDFKLTQLKLGVS